MAIVLTFDGAVGSVSEVVDGYYTGRAGGPFTYREGKAQAIRELAEREGIDLAASWAYSDSESDLPMLRAVGHPVAVQPRQGPPRVAREEGWEILRFDRRRLRFAGAAVARRGGRRRRWRSRGRAHEPSHELTAEQQEIRDAGAPVRRRADRAARRLVGPRARLSARAVRGARRAGADGRVRARGAGRRGRRLPLLRARARGAVARRRRRGGDGRRPHQRLHAAAAGARRRRTCRRWPPGEEIGAFALTEPGSGSDAGAMRTRAADGRITGSKQWCTNGSHASTFLVFAREDERVSAFVVRAGADGFAVTREEEKMGLNSSSTADLSFEDTPGERLGEPGEGMRIALRTLDGRPDRDRRPGGRDRPGGARRRHRVREGARRVRRPDRALPGDPAQAGRHADRDRGGARADLARRAAEGGRPSAHGRGRAGEAVRQRASRAARPARRSRSSAATATRRSSRPSATTATRRSPRSTRARARSRSSSSPARCSATRCASSPRRRRRTALGRRRSGDAGGAVSRRRCRNLQWVLSVGPVVVYRQ